MHVISQGSNFPSNCKCKVVVEVYCTVPGSLMTTVYYIHPSTRNVFLLGGRKKITSPIKKWIASSIQWRGTIIHPLTFTLVKTLPGYLWINRRLIKLEGVWVGIRWGGGELSPKWRFY